MIQCDGTGDYELRLMSCHGFAVLVPKFEGFTMAHYFLAGLLIALACQQSSATQESTTDGKQALREKWITRVTTELAELDEETRASAVPFVAIALATAGQIDCAEDLVERSLPPERRPSIRVLIAGILSEQERVEDALEIVTSLPGLHQDSGHALVAIRQAQRGHLGTARTLLPQIKEQYHRDRVLDVIAEAEAIAGQIAQARENAGKITEKDRRNRILKMIKSVGEMKDDALPVFKLRSPMLREQLRTLLLFTGTDGQREAIGAILTAQDKDPEKLSEHIGAAMDDSRSKIPLERATTRLLLAVALVEADREADAKHMIQEARQQIGEGWLGISSIFGNPILVHLLIRLEMDNELESFMKSLESSDSDIEEITYHANLQAMGTTFVELKYMKDAETYYQRMTSSLDRVYFAAGVLYGLDASEG